MSSLARLAVGFELLSGITPEDSGLLRAAAFPGNKTAGICRATGGTTLDFRFERNMQRTAVCAIKDPSTPHRCARDCGTRLGDPSTSLDGGCVHSMSQNCVVDVHLVDTENLGTGLQSPGRGLNELIVEG